ncbi:hypothetical protein TNCV_417731 [Trichonephila clavipes]|nr:hypothetical protein TNCV_417731 [Trichonephila clavipes]
MLEKVIENWTSRLDYIRASRGSPMPEIIFKIPLDEDDLIKFMTVCDNKEVGDDEVEGEIKLFTTDLIGENLEFATSMKQHFLTHEPVDIKRALKFQRNLMFYAAGY